MPEHLTPARPFMSFDAAAPAERVRDGRAALLRTAAALTWLAMSPGFAFVRQRSNFILGWETAAAAGHPLGRGTSAGAVGSADSPVDPARSDRLTRGTPRD